jgi:ABC-type oligopeptide transport system substrate-binding subunit
MNATPKTSRRGRLSLAATILVLASALPACRSGDSHRSAEERRRAGVVVYNLASEPTTLDPARATRLSDLRAVGQCLEGLARVGANGRPEPAAAESWEISPDARTYRFRLREARWSNGDPVRSSDFAFAWRRVLDPATRAYWPDLFFVIEGAKDYYRASPQERSRLRLGIETPDDRTLIVHLTLPIPYFLSLVALEAYFPVHQATVDGVGDAAFRAPDYVCNGPFRLIEHVPRRQMVFTPNPDYRDHARVALNRLIFVMVENEFTEWMAYRRGEIDVTDGVPRSVLATARDRADFRSTPLMGTSYLVFNCRRPPFDRAEVRRAFALSLDRRLLAERIMRGGEMPATAFVPPGIPSQVGQVGQSGNPSGSDFRAEAGDLISATGPSPNEATRLRASLAALPREIVYAHETTEEQRSLAVAMQMMWRETLGVEVAIQSFPARLLAQNKRRGDTLIAHASWVADYLDPTTFLDILRSDSPNNFPNWSDSRYDALLDEAAATPDTARRADLLHQAERLLMDQMPICPLYFYAIAYLQRSGLEGVERNRLGRVDFSRAQWAGEKQQE